MFKRILFFSTLFLIIVAGTSCIFMGPSIRGNGNVVSENRAVKSFNKITVSRGMNVYISQGDETSVVVKADENLLKAIETINEGGALKVTVNQRISRYSSLRVYLTTPEITEIKAFAGSTIFSETTLKSDELKLSSSSGSNVKVTVHADELNATTSAGSNLMIEGKTNTFTGKASSGSNLKAGKLNAHDASVRSSSGANIWVTVKNNFEGHASSGGNIFYLGQPKSVDVHSSSGGNVIKK
ncbi:MAG: DUF2807 domain-containing protein [Prolixibacteraceae bacterium]|nr:DUF2807 domain-containing protein [Prolixibacteraceae bacterium]